MTALTTAQREHHAEAERLLESAKRDGLELMNLRRAEAPAPGSANELKRRERELDVLLGMAHVHALLAAVPR